MRTWVPLLSTFAVGACGLGVALLRSLPAASVTTALPAFPAEGPLAYDVRDADTGQSIPCKLTFVGVAGSGSPHFTKFDIGRQEGDAILAYDRIMSATGQGFAHVPAGTYDVYVSRGPEWELSIAHAVKVTPKGATVTARLKHTVDTTGWISADFHVHAQMSTDSHVPMHDRIYEFLSDGVEVITSTDHNVIADYAPLIAELGVGNDITSLIGDEMTTGRWGHFGAFPLPQNLEGAGHGAVLVHGRTPSDFFGDVRRNAPEAIINVHHPRIDREIGYFNLAGFDPAHDRGSTGAFSHDFDAIEVMNGYQDSERRSIDRVLLDWYALLDHGHVVTATGNSDTHHLNHNIGGYPRNYVRVADDQPPHVKPEFIARAVRAHNTMFTTAPFVLLHAGDAGIGGTANATSGKVKVEVEVRAAQWVSVSSVMLVHDGREVKRWSVPAGAPTGPGGVRFKETIELDVARDGWVLARAEGNVPLAPVVGDRVHFDVRPYAMTNPVFLDHDGNGRYDAPLATAAHLLAKPSAPPPLRPKQ